MSEQLSLSELVRNYIIETHKNDSKYFETVSEAQRVKDFQIFCNKNKSQGLEYSKHRNMLITQLRKIGTSIGVDISKIGLKKPVEKHMVTKGQQQGQVKINPKKITGQYQKEPTSQQAQQQNQEIHVQGCKCQQCITNQQTQQQNQTNENVLHPPNCQCFNCLRSKGIYEEIDVETAGAPFEVLADIWHAKNPKFKVLTQDEVRRLGKAWSPIFSRYIGGDILFFMAPVIVTAQCFLGRAMESREHQEKDKTEKKRDKANDKTSKEKPKQERDYSDEPTEESDTGQVKRKFFSSKKVNEIIEDGKNED